jgi:hypothetical protein
MNLPCYPHRTHSQPVILHNRARCHHPDLDEILGSDAEVSTSLSQFRQGSVRYRVLIVIRLQQSQQDIGIDESCH